MGSQGLAALPEAKLKETCSSRAQTEMRDYWEGTAYTALLGEVAQD